MVDYSIISNQELRELVMKSVSIQSLAEDKLAEMVKQIAVLPLAGREDLTAFLAEEAKKIEEAGNLTPEEQAKMKEDFQRIVRLKKGLDKDIRVESEQIEVAESSKVAENLLNNL